MSCSCSVCCSCTCGESSLTIGGAVLAVRATTSSTATTVHRRHDGDPERNLVRYEVVDVPRFVLAPIGQRLEAEGQMGETHAWSSVGHTDIPGWGMFEPHDGSDGRDGD